MTLGKNNLDFLNNDADTAAKQLLGCYLTRNISNNILKIKIVETESYDQNDAASHSFSGKTKRTSVMFGPSGYLYVYFTYGMHYCCNVVVGKIGNGTAVLIRAAEPIAGIELMIKNRSGKTGTDLTNGPAKTCQALKIDKELNGHNLRESPLILTAGNKIPESQITVTKRIGITKEKDRLRRYFITGNPYVSA